MTLKLITAPTAEPVTLAEAKLVCKVDGTAEDAYITGLISAAREQAEQELGRSLATATWERVLDAFPDSGIRLGWPHVASIVSVKYIDTAGTLQTLPSTDYTLDADFLPGWVLPSATAPSWPATLDTANAVRVQFQTGWAEGAVPESIKSWIKMRVATAFKAREFVVLGQSMAEMPRSHGDGLLDKWRVFE
jgi:uncharacterized phiE125 gp8 family phage protein